MAAPTNAEMMVLVFPAPVAVENTCLQVELALKGTELVNRNRLIRSPGAAQLVEASGTMVPVPAPPGGIVLAAMFK